MTCLWLPGDFKKTPRLIITASLPCKCVAHGGSHTAAVRATKELNFGHMHMCGGKTLPANIYILASSLLITSTIARDMVLSIPYIIHKDNIYLSEVSSKNCFENNAFEASKLLNQFQTFWSPMAHHISPT